MLGRSMIRILGVCVLGTQCRLQGLTRHIQWRMIQIDVMYLYLIVGRGFVTGDFRFYAMIRFGPSIGWKAMLWKSTSFDIFCEIPLENADICSCMYMRNVSDDQRPIF